MTFVHHSGPGAGYIRERRGLLISVIADRREGPLVRISVSASLAASLGWRHGDRLSAGIGRGTDAGWIELAPADHGPLLRNAARGSRLVWILSKMPEAPARHRVATTAYVRSGTRRDALHIRLPWASQCAMAAE